jgi:hypothetical protein
MKTRDLNQGSKGFFSSAFLKCRGTIGAFLIVLTAAIPTTAQDFSIDWYTIDGGGGTSTDAVYTVTGTIGQSTAGNVSGDGYSLDSGFWGVIATEQTPGAPVLVINLGPLHGEITLSWDATALGFELQETSLLDGLLDVSSLIPWLNVKGTCRTNEGRVCITLPTPAGSRIYRLVSSTPSLKFYLHGNDIPGTAGGFTMNQAPAPGQTLSLNLLSSPSWFSDPPLNHTFQEGATFKVVFSPSVGLSVAQTFRLASTNPDGSGEQSLGQTTQLLGGGTQTIAIPVTTPVTLAGKRLKLTISSSVSLGIDLQLDNGAYLEATSSVESE